MASSSSVTSTLLPGGWTERDVCVGARSFRLILPAEPDALLEQLEGPATPEQDEPELFWAQVWPSALPMAEAVLNAMWPPGEDVLEIGCGIGLVGLAALAAGHRVTLTDGVPLAVQLAAENARRNGFAAFRAFPMDWHHPRQECFPVILGSDVLYDKQNHGPLLQLLETMLAPGGVCWFGDPGRYHTPAFVQQAQQRGFRLYALDETGKEVLSQRPGCFQLLVLERTTNKTP
jgi:predicted nicotinamide N-methyase